MLVALLLAAYATAAVLLCPIPTSTPTMTPAGSQVSDAHAGGHAHAAGDHAAHASDEAPRTLQAPCPCGCGDGPASGVRATARLGFALLRDLPSAPEPSFALPLEGVQTTLFSALLSPADPIPI